LSLAATGWVGGATPALLGFLPNALAYFLVIVNCRTRKQFQAVAVLLLLVCLFVIAHGVYDLGHENFHSNYLTAQSDSEGVALYRLRGEASISDPNDFSQLLVSLIPLLFLFWHKKKFLRNMVLVIVPAAVLVFGMYLTHSRGGILALMAVMVIAGWKRLGLARSLTAGGIAFAILTALGWTGGRSISVEQGAGRMEAWAIGLQLFRGNPFFGVGYQRFTEFFEITAHNSIVVCAAELGFFGLFFWVLLVLPSMRGALSVAFATREPELAPPDAHERLPLRPVEELSREQINQLGNLIFLSLSGFLIAGWFLSRAYVMILFIYAALAETVLQIAMDRGMVPKRISLARLLPMVGATAISLVLLIYVSLRINNLLH